MSQLIITMDLDWASEAAIEEALGFLLERNAVPTIFTTHRSPIVEACMNKLDVGLHPYFGPDSSHGETISEVVRHVLDLPHNLSAFRCHRFGVCNTSRQAMVEAGMKISSNVCTDLEIIAPFRDRFGLLEVPIFLEDGGYLWRKHSLEVCPKLRNALIGPEKKVILIHPMHLALNTPHFEYMHTIKQSVSRQEWNALSSATLQRLRWQGRGIRDLLADILKIVPGNSTLRTL